MLANCQLLCPSEARNEVKSEGVPTNINTGEMRQIQTLIQQGVICANMSNYGDPPVPGIREGFLFFSLQCVQDYFLRTKNRHLHNQ